MGNLFHHIFKIFKMSEGRRAQVILLDERKVELTIAPKLSGGDLLDLVVSYCNLKEKEYFGLAFMDETNHYNWLQPDKKVLDHELPRPPPGEALTLYFRVQYFSESIAKLRDSITIELFYLQAKESVYKGEIEVDSETAFELAAYVLQAVDGDYRSYQRAVDTLKKLPVLPQSTLKDHPSLLFCEERILFYYKQNIGFTTGQAIVCYMQVIESLPTYGVHYYEVKDKSGLPWWLGLSYKGIGQYDQGDRVTPRNVFHWKQLQNIYYQNRKFSIEVLDSKRVSHSLNSIELFQQQPQDQDSFDDLTDALTDPTTQVTVSRRTFGGGNATVHAWYGHPLMIRSMWTMAVSQHQFYLDRKHSKEMPANDKSLSQIANDLTVSTISLSSSQTSEHSSDDKLRGSTSSLKGSVSTLSKLKDKEKSSRELLAIEGEEARQQMVEALKERKAVLEERLREKIEALKKLCIKEAEITNKLPEEYPLTPGEPSPKFKRRMTTLYKLSDKHVNVEEFKNSEEQELNRLEKEFEIQSNITTAARKLANDPNISKKVRKTRRDSYKKSALKLDKIHKQLNTIRLQLGMSVIDSISMEVREDISNMESPGRKFSFTGTLPRKLGERGRSRTKESPDGKGRSKSVPRQLLDNFTRSPSLSRDEKEAPKRAPSPVILSTETIRKENFTNLATKPPPGRRVESNQYESIPRDLRRNNSDDGIAGDRHSYGTDTSSHSSASSRGLYNRTNSEYSVSVRKSTPPIYQSLQRLPRSGKGNNGSIEDFRIRLGSNNSLDSDLRAKRRGSTEAVPSHTRPTPPTALFMEGNPNSPPPVYGMVPRSYRQTGRYFESPELSSPIHEVQTSPKHAVSMHNLQHTAAPSQQYPSYTYDTDGYTHQAGRSVSQPPTPKKHASLGNLASQVNNSPTLEEEDTMTSNSMKGQLETGRGQGEHLSQGRYNVPRRHYDLDGDQYQYGYTQTDKGMHQSPRRGSHVPPQETVQSGRRRHNSFSSQHSTSSQSSINSHQSHSSQRSQTSLNQNGARNPGSHHSTPVKNKHVSVSYVTGSNGHQWSVNHGDHYPPPYQREDSFEQYQNYSQGNYPQGYDYHPRDSYDSYPQEENFGYQEDYNNYYSDQAYELPNFSTTYQEEPLQTSDNGDAYRSFTTQQSYSQSGLTIRAVSTPAIQSSQVPQPAPAYMTSAPAVSHSPHPPVYGTTIAVSKVHYQPATPMTCEPVTRKKKHHSHHLAGSPAFMRTLDYGYNYYCLPSLIALEDSDPVFLQRSEFSSPEGSEDSRENYSPYIEDAEYAADVDEYAEDDYDNEATQWNPEREPDRPPLQGKVRTGTLV